MNDREYSLKSFLIKALDDHGHKIASSIYRKGAWESFTFIEILALATEVSNSIQAHELKAEDKVAIILDSCSEYAAAFFGAGMLGHTVLLMDSKLTTEEMKSIFLHSDSKIILTGFGATAAAQRLVTHLEFAVPLIEVDKISIPNMSSSFLREKIDMMACLEPEDTALLVYTSGTTSEPKGVMLTMKNVLMDSKLTTDAILPQKNAIFMSILPLNHMLEFCGGMITPFRLGAQVVYANTMLPHEIMERLQAYKYTDMIVVPLFLRTVMNSILRTVNKNKTKKAYFKGATLIAQLIPFKAVRKFAFYPINKQLGFLNRFICGGAALDKCSQTFFTLMGITVTQGYGLTETSPISTVNYTGDKVMGSQGRAIPGTELKIDPATEEILIRGPHVMKGYYKRPEITNEVITADGWFKTGDLGRLDKEGNLFITGRLKELIVLGNGKKVFPDEVEASFKNSANIKDFMVLGVVDQTGHLKNTESVCAVIVPSEEMQKLYPDQSTLKTKIEAEIRKMTEGLATYKRPSKFIISYSELPKTSTKKNKRTHIRKMIMEGALT